MTANFSREDGQKQVKERSGDELVRDGAIQIFCRPSCKSRPQSQQDVRIFEDARQARAQGFRACTSCKPDKSRFLDAEWVGQLAKWIKIQFPGE